MTAENFLMFIDGAVQVSFYDTKILQIFLFLFSQTTNINIFFFQIFYPASNQFPVFLKFFFGVADSIQIFQKDFFVILYGVIQCISSDFSHSFLNLLKLDPHQVKYIFYLIHSLVVALLFQMHLKDHFVNGKLHIIFNFKGGKYKIIPVIGKIIGRSANLLIKINNTVRHITDMHNMIGILLEIVPVKIHGTAFVGQNDVDNKIPQLPAVLVGDLLLQISGIKGINICPDIIHGTIFFFQGLLHNVKHNSKNKIQLFIKF